MRTGRLPPDVVRRAPCVAEDLPYAAAAAAFARCSLLLPSTAFGYTLRSLVCCEVFHGMEELLRRRRNPTAAFVRLLDRYSGLMRTAAQMPHAWRTQPDSRAGSLEQQTGQHYGRLFRRFSSRQYSEAYTLLRTRFERNGLRPGAVKGLKALDAGCGGGRYTLALRRLGFARVIGVDFSEDGIRDANARLRGSAVRGVSFRRASVLDLPFRDESFDFVFSNGVLHHTKDMARGFRELLRVLKSGGGGFVYVIEKPGGIFWDTIELLRVLMHPVSHDVAREQFQLLGLESNRVFYILDHVMAPINIRSTNREVEALLRDAGAGAIRRLERGTHFDRIERIFRREPHARLKFGVGEQRYFFRKA